MSPVARLDDLQIQQALNSLQGWELREGKISRLYRFKEFMESIEFANRVAKLAETHDHHHDILIRYNKVQLTLVTHSAGGLTEKDFQLAREIDTP